MRKDSTATASRAVTTPTGIVRRVRDTKRPGTGIIVGAPKPPAVLGRLFNRRGPGIEIENKSGGASPVGEGPRRQPRHRPSDMFIEPRPPRSEEHTSELQ